MVQRDALCEQAEQPVLDRTGKPRHLLQATPPDARLGNPDFDGHPFRHQQYLQKPVECKQTELFVWLRTEDPLQARSSVLLPEQNPANCSQHFHLCHYLLHDVPPE